MLSSFLFVITLFIAWIFMTTSGHHFRYLVADTLISSQHRIWAKYVIGDEALKSRVNDYQNIAVATGSEKATHEIKLTENVSNPTQAKPVEIKEISGKGYKGHIVYVRDPKSLRLVVPDKAGKGEKVSSMVKRTGALLGVNAGGFADPNWKGNGFVPIGLVISNGEIFFDSSGRNKPAQIVGIDKTGKMIAGNYSPNELLKLDIKEAVTFQPRLIVNGKGQLKNEAQGWGIAPRTAMGQKADGTILFVIVDGRQPGHSIGTNLYEIQQILLSEGAVIAANLDGGSSTVLVEGNGSNNSDESEEIDPRIVNKPASQHGERYLPTAFLVFEQPEAITIPNIWAHATKEQLDPSRW
ncbi:phosphodiester glycosidase family protein [Paenibacillus swuensis]|nr:phosphodiester glycosidase family protein [Paenibacillus swuensis]